jgi:phosphoenolpyruvate synthase/pyruvate phosphate dikinase
MGRYVLSFQEINKTMLSMVGGKGANLGELINIREIQVPQGFCITTEAYKDITESNQELKDLLNQLIHLKAEER